MPISRNGIELLLLGLIEQGVSEMKKLPSPSSDGPADASLVSCLRRLLEIYQGAFDDRPGATDRQQEAEHCFDELAKGGEQTLDLLERHLEPGGLIVQFHPVLGVRPLAGLVLQIAINEDRSQPRLRRAMQLLNKLPVIPATQEAFEGIQRTLTNLMTKAGE